MGQIVSAAAKPKRCNKNQLSQRGVLAAGLHVLVSSDNSMNAAGQGNFDCYIVGDGTTAATALELKQIGVDREFKVYSETEELVMANYQTSPYVIMGKYINTDGTLGNSSVYFITHPIFLKAGNTIYFNLRGSGIGYLCTATSADDGGPYTVLMSGAPNNANRNYTATEDCYVVLCGQTMISNNYIRFLYEKEGQVVEIQNTLNEIAPYTIGLKEYLPCGNVSLTFIEGSYVYRDGIVYESPYYHMSSEIVLERGDILTIKNAKGYNGGIAILARKTGSTYVPVILDVNDVTDYEFINAGTRGAFVISCNNSLVVSVTKKHDVTFAYTSVLQAGYDNIFAGVPKFGIIGDSLASGSSVDGSFRQFSWWKVLERDAGATYGEFCAGGMNTRRWITDANYGLPVAILPENKCQAYVIALGVNDRTALGDSYLGTSADIDMSDPTNNADTFYGNYARIIQTLTTAFGSKFIVMTDPRVESGFNEAIRYMAATFANVYLLDLYADYGELYDKGGVFYQFQDTSAHYSSLGYMMMGKFLEMAISRVMMNNLPDFLRIENA